MGCGYGTKGSLLPQLLGDAKFHDIGAPRASHRSTKTGWTPSSTKRTIVPPLAVFERVIVSSCQEENSMTRLAANKFVANSYNSRRLAPSCSVVGHVDYRAGGRGQGQKEAKQIVGTCSSTINPRCVSFP